MTAETYIPAHKWPIHVGNAVAPTLISLNLLPQSLDAHSLMEEATRQTKLDDFGDDKFLEPFHILTEDLSRDPSFHQIGRWFHRQQLMEKLKNRLYLTQAWKDHPEVLEQDVGRPLIIIGLPRTGTTHLMNLLSCDEDHRILSFWEGSKPASKPRKSIYQLDTRRLESSFVIKTANYLIPQLRRVHNLRLDGPEECILLLGNSFRSQLFVVEYSVPTYLEWLKTCDHQPAYAEHKKQLQLLQRTRQGSRWLLKAPTHMVGIDGLLETYPDAMIIQTHRDPVKAIPSICSLTLAARSAGLSEIDKHEIGQQMMDHLTSAMDHFLDRREETPQNFYDVMYEDLVSDPLNVIEQIYSHFNLELTKHIRKNMHTELTKHPKNKHGTHRYSAKDFGLSEGDIRDKFERYTTLFGV